MAAHKRGDKSVDGRMAEDEDEQETESRWRTKMAVDWLTGVGGRSEQLADDRNGILDRLAQLERLHQLVDLRLLRGQLRVFGGGQAQL
jgi:hypothetical protein